MMRMLNENHGRRRPVLLPETIYPLALMALAGMLYAPSFWPAIYGGGGAAGLALLWLSQRAQTAPARTGSARYSSLLAALAALGLLFALGCWAQRGLNHPLTHAGNGIAALLLLLAGLNEKYGPRPWVARTLRAQRQALSWCWAGAFYTAGAGAALFLLPVLMREPGLAREIAPGPAGGTPALSSLSPLALAAAAGYWLSAAWLRRNAAATLLNRGLLSCALGVGILWLNMDYPQGWFSLLPAQLLLGLGHGITLRTLPLAVAGRSAPELRPAAVRLLAAMQYAGGAAAAGITVIVLTLYPGARGYACAFGLLAALCLCAAVAGLMAQEPAAG
ncbi:hypothetical protein ACL2XP_15790 [Sodalis sp. RH21]|uniref:hypothetical protein n=1 Tax=unclassified Sodalis (in: enterobacteria) TaxID=2636512 RepID=UPI0039B4F756